MWKFGGGGKMANQSAQQEHCPSNLYKFIFIYGLGSGGGAFGLG
jgi:hypothetical protein